MLAVRFVPFSISLFNVPSLLLQINEGINNVQAKDVSSLKASVIDYLLVDTTARLDPPIQWKEVKKSDHGFSHQQLHLYCALWSMKLLRSMCVFPACRLTDQWLHIFRTYNIIMTGKKSLTAHDLPYFLYPDEHVYDPEDMDKGLLTGHLPLHVSYFTFYVSPPDHHF